MSTFCEIRVDYPFIGTLSITPDTLKRKKLIFQKNSGETKYLNALNQVSLKDLRRFTSPCLAKFIKVDLLANKVCFEQGLKGGGQKPAKSKPISLDKVSNQIIDQSKIANKNPPTEGFADIIWLDAKVYNKENTEYFKEAPEIFFIKRFDNLLDSVSSINSYRRKKTVVIVSGALAENLVQKIKLEYISTIIIFCSTLKLFNNFTRKYRKINHVLNDFSDIVEVIEENYLSIKDDVKHIQHTTNSYLGFHKLLNAMINSKMINKDNIIEELSYLNMNKKDTIKRIIETEKPNLAEAVIYLYTKNCIYNHFNSAFKNDELNKVILSASLCLKDIMRDSKYHVTGEYIYRGIKFSDLSEYKNALKNSTPIFFPGFISASQLKSVAKNFAGRKGIIFKIRLNREKPYPHVRLTEGMTKFKNEEEIISMSHIPLYVKNIKENKRIVLLEQFKYLKVKISFIKISFDIEFEEFLLVKDIKRIIKSKTGIPIQFQIFDYHNINFENDRIFKNYFQCHNDLAIDLRYKLYGNVSYIVFLKALKLSESEYLLKGKDLYGKDVTIKIKAQSPIIELKKKLEDIYNYSCSKDLFYEGSVVSDNLDLKSLLTNSSSFILLYADYCKKRINSISGFKDLDFGCKSMRIYVKTLSGKLIVLDVNSCDLVKDAKYKIQDIEGIPPDMQRLIFSNTTLEDEKRLSDYKIESESTMFLVLKLGRGLLIFVKIFSKKTTKIEANVDMNIKEVKQYITEKEGIPCHQHSLIFAGKELVNEKTLDEYNIIKESIFFLKLEMQIDDKIIFFKYYSEKIRISVNISTTIGDIKDKISNLGIYLRNALYFKGQQLNDKKSIEYYSIQFNSTLHTKFTLECSIFSNQTCLNNISDFFERFGCFRAAVYIYKKALIGNKLERNIIEVETEHKLITIVIKFFTGNILSLNTSKNEKIWKIKQKIQQNTSIPCYEQILEYKNYELLNQETVESAGIKKNSILYLIPLFRFDPSSEGIKAYINKHHIGDINNLRKILYLAYQKKKLYYKISLNIEIYFEGKLINSLNELPSRLCLIYIYNQDNENYRMCNNCSVKLIDLIPYQELTLCKTHFESLLKTCDSCGEKSIFAELRIQKDQILCKACDFKGSSNFILINSIAIEKNSKSFMHCDNLIVYQPYNSVYIYRNSCDHLYLTKILNIEYINIICGSKDTPLIFCSDSMKLYVYNLQDGAYLFEEYINLPQATLMISTGNLLVVLSKDFNILIFKLIPFTLKYELKGHTNTINCIEITSNGEKLFSSENKLVKVWSLENRKLEFELKGHKGQVTCMKINKSNELLITGSVDRNIIIWDLLTYSIIHKIEAHKREIRGIAISDNNKYMVSGGQDLRVNVWSLESCQLITSIVEKSWINHVEISSDSKHIYSELNNGTINCYALNYNR